MRLPVIAILSCCAVGASASTTPRRPTEPPGHITLTVVLATPSPDPTEVRRTIELPADMVAIAMSLEMAGEHGSSALMSAADALSTYSYKVWRIRDPALLEYVDAHHALLRVFPVRRDFPATVSIELAPRAEARENMVPYLGEWASLYAEPGVVPPAEPEDLLAALTRPDAP